VTFPIDQPPVPEVVARLAAGRPVIAVWRNELGGNTFRIGAGEEYVKVCSADLAAEALRLNWARRFAPVPEVLGTGPGWLHTVGLPGRSAVDPYWISRPAEAAHAIGAGLRGLHDALPLPDCPFGRPAWLSGGDLPPADVLVVCHGDACAPNTLIADDGTCAGHVDLGDLGVADRWSDLAVASMSLSWNYDSLHEDALFAGYGVNPDRSRIAYYRRRWQQAPPTGV
jgi:kanamycin kinase